MKKKDILKIKKKTYNFIMYKAHNLANYKPKKLQSPQSSCLFLDYINLPTTSYAAIILKHTLIYSDKHKLDKINYKDVKFISENLFTKWDTAKIILRKLFKEWEQNYKIKFFKIYGNINFEDKSIITIINSLISAYKTKKHLFCKGLTLYDVSKISESRRFLDRMLIMNKTQSKFSLQKN